MSDEIENLPDDTGDDLVFADDEGALATGEEKEFERRDQSEENKLKRSIFSVPIEVTVTVGTARPLIGELLGMSRDHLLPLDSSIDDPVELRVKDRVIARGELTQTDEGEGKLGIRLTEIIELTDLT